MNAFQALILGILQGLTEFLPVSSSGHLEIGSALLGVTTTNNLFFAVLVHVATVLSTLVVFRKDIVKLMLGIFAFKWNNETKFASLILLSMIPVMFAGLFLKDEIEGFFTGNLVLVGTMLLITALLLALTYYTKPDGGPISPFKAFLIGVAQMFAVIPGISRSGATIATGLLLGIKKDEVARFSFLMVIIPILGAALLDLLNPEFSIPVNISPTALVTGFLAAFLSGLFACSFMIKMVKRGKLIYFALYCLLIGLIAIFAG